MKRILVVIVLVFSFSSIFAQEVRISEEMEFYTKELNIEDSQRASLSKIIIRKQKDLEAINDFAKTDETLFRQKRRNIYKGAENSIRLILNESQLETWKIYKKKTRKANAEKIKSLQATNASKQDLLDAQYGINND